jgi:hypothetical protein
MRPPFQPGECSIIVSSKSVLRLAEEAWARFESVVPDHPLREWRCGPPVFSLPEAHHIAEGSIFASDERLGTLAGIRLHKDFFELPEGRQTLTLLHEAIHVALFAGECKDWYEESKALDKTFCQHPFELHQNPARRLVARATWPVALALFQLKHEIAAEKALQIRYSDLGLDRAEYYQSMQEENWEDRDDLTLPAELQPFALLFRLLCAEVSRELASGRLAGRPERLCGLYRTELLSSSRPELEAVVPILLDVGVSPCRVDLAAYRAILEETLRARPPSRSDWPDWPDWTIEETGRV